MKYGSRFYGVCLYVLATLVLVYTLCMLVLLLVFLSYKVLFMASHLTYFIQSCLAACFNDGALCLFPVL